MDERIINFRVGAVVIVAVLLTATLILFFREGNVWSNKYTLYMYFTRAPNVTDNTPIRKNGILIGRVTSVRLLDDGVEVTGSIDDKYKLHKNEIPSIGAGSLFGDSAIEFSPDPALPKSDEYYADGAKITAGKVASDPLSVLVNLEPELTSAVNSIDAAGKEMSTAAGSFNNLIGNNEARFNRIITKTESTIDEFNTSLTSINKVLGDEQLTNDLKQSIEKLPAMLNEIDQTFAEGRQAIAGFRRVSDSAERNLQNLEDLTRPLGERGEQLAGDIERSVHNVDLLLAQLVEFSTALNNREGTLGRLVYDTELYDRLNKTITNVEDVSRQFQPIVNDVRIFTDKLARDPRQLGLKGALDSRPLGVGTKANPRYVDSWGDAEPAFDLDQIYPPTAH